MNAKGDNIKAIMFVRVSSNAQDYTRQITELTPLIKSDGYKDSEVAIIHHKESATKNDFNSRQSLQELQNYINNCNIQNVYVHEISRLARRSDVMYKVMALLEEHKICLVCATPTLLRTIENGAPNPVAHMMFAFLSQVAQSEMEQKNIRTMTGRAQKLKEGKLATKALFGYKRNKEGYAILDPQRSQEIKQLFQLINEGYTALEICEQMKYTAFLEGANEKSGKHRIYRAIKNERYAGNLNYPAIVTKEEQEKAMGQLLQNTPVKDRKKRTPKGDYLGKHLVFNVDGYMLSATQEYNRPAYVAHNGDIVVMNAQALDDLAWAKSVEIKAELERGANKEQRERARKQLPILEDVRVKIQKQIDSIEGKRERANELYVLGNSSKATYQKMLGKLDAEHSRLLNEQNANAIQIAEMQKVIDGDNTYLSNVSSYNNLLDIEDKTVQASITHEIIKRIVVSKHSATNNARRVMKIEIEYNKTLYNYPPTYYLYIVRGSKRELMQVIEESDGTMITTDLTPSHWNQRRTTKRKK